MNTTTEPMPTIHEASLLANGRLVPALLQAVRDERMSAEGAHLAFAQAVPVVAARLGISSRAIIIVTENGELPYGPNGLTIAEECEQEALEALEADEPTTLAAEQPASVVPTHDSDVVSFLGNTEPLWIHLGQAKAYATWPEAALVRRPAHRSELPADLGAHRAAVVPLTWREALVRIRETLSVCFGRGDRFRA